MGRLIQLVIYLNKKGELDLIFKFVIYFFYIKSMGYRWLEVKDYSLFECFIRYGINVWDLLGEIKKLLEWGTILVIQVKGYIVFGVL